VNGRRSVGSILVARGYINEQALDGAIAVQQHTKERLLQILIDQGFINDDIKAQVLAEQWHMPFVDVMAEQIEADALAVDQERAKHYGFVAFKHEEGVVSIALSDPTNIELMDYLVATYGRETKFFVAPKNAIYDAIEKYYLVGNSIKEAGSEAKAEIIAETGEEVSIEQLREMGQDAPVIRLVNTIITQAVGEMRRQIDWKLKAVEGPVSGMRASQSPERDPVPAIERKSKATEPDDSTRNTLETLYDETVVGESVAGAVPASEPPVSVPTEEAGELSGPQDTVPADQNAEGESSQLVTARDVVPDTSGEVAVETLPVPHQAVAPSVQANAAAAGSVSREAFIAPPSPTPGQEAEQQLIGILRDVSQGTMKREDLMQRLSDAGSVSIPLSLGVLYLSFLRSPQDAQVMSDLLTWLERSGYTRFLLFVVEEALALGARVDFHDPQIASIVLSADGGEMAAELRTRKAELLLERGDTASYVSEELGMVRQVGGIVRQLVHVLEHCLVDDACTHEVLAVATELGVLDPLVDRITEDANMAKVPTLEAAIVERLGRTAVDESTFLNNDGLFQRVTLSVEKSVILRRILANAVHPMVRRKALQCLLVLGTPSMAEFTELVGLMAMEHDTSDTAYLLQYLVDHRQEVENVRFLLEKLARLVPMDFESRYGLGLAAEQLGVHDAAAEYFVAAIRAHPGDPDTVEHALKAVFASGNYDLIADATSLSQLSPADVEGLVDKAAAETPGITAGSAEQRLVSVWTAFAGSRYEEAVAMSARTLRGGGDPRFYLPMALAFVHLGLPELATRQLDHAIYLPNVTDEAKLVLKYHAAVIHLEQGNIQQAAQLFHEVDESSPGFRDTEELLNKCGSQGSKVAKL